MEIEIKKKRGRKPKTPTTEIVENVEKKKRGRKKKYEVENFEKILHRESENNFNHHVIYSDDENNSNEENCVKKVSFGNLDITVSKRIETEDINEFKLKTRKYPLRHCINTDEYSSDDEKEVSIESFINCTEKNFSESKRYIPKVVSECNNVTDSTKKIKVVSTTRDQIKQTDEWPLSCNVCCWWCCHTFDGTPCTLPTKYDPLRKRFTFAGLFCSWSCVKSYNFDSSNHKKYECSSLITLLLQQIHGVSKAIRIKPAPPRQCLKMFGGYMDIETFRGDTDVDQYNLNLIKFNYIYPEVTEIRNVKNKIEKKNFRLSRPV